MSILVVGAGLSGLTIAERYASIGQEVIVIDKRPHIGGNCFDFVNEDGQMVSRYGPHAFHTNDEEVWQYINQFATWRPFEYKALSMVDGMLVPIPVNIATVNAVLGTSLRSEDDMVGWLKENVVPIANPQNSEESALARLGTVLYEKMFKNHTRKQWDVFPAELDASVLARIPVRTNFDTRYFTDRYQALPAHGYTEFCQTVVDQRKIQVLLNTDWSQYRDQAKKFSKVFFTGPIDRYFDHRLGFLQYRSVRFEFETVPTDRFQEAPAVHFPQAEGFTRIVEYKQVYPSDSRSTTIAKEFPTWEGEPYYPVPSRRNHEIYERYRQLASEAEKEGLFFVGRLANYKYFNMDQAIRNALDLFSRVEG